jgi:RimJ/RimL family protein N-acetyltransferase
MTCLGSYDTEKKKLVGVVGFDNWSTASVEMHVAGEGRWLSREMLVKSFLYPFMVGGVNVAIIRMDGGNTRAIKFVKKLGFVEACRIPRAWEEGRDMVIAAMHKENCRWIRPQSSHLEEAA